MHGLDQSQALTKAAQELSAAKQNLIDVYSAAHSGDEGYDLRDAAIARYARAKAARYAAYLLYTNPFGVVKTV